MPRRHFLRIGGAVAATAVLSQYRPVMAGPFEPDPSGNLVPVDKKLSAGWLRALHERGEPDWFTGDELKYIGMPVGGIACGQIYLGGDGRLWHWDIFGPRYDSPYISSPYGPLNMGHHYANPPKPDDPVHQPLNQGFALRIRQGETESIRTLDGDGFREIRFRGEYPIGRVQFRDEATPLEVDLEAFSPFLPLNAADSGLPCTLMNYTLRNSDDASIQVDIAGWIENAICPNDNDASFGIRRVTFDPAGLTCSVHEPVGEGTTEARAPIVFADFEGDDYGKWRVEGDAFGDHPFNRSELASFDRLKGFVGRGLVNTHETRSANEDPQKADSFTGTLTSPDFTISRNYVTFRIGGGRQPGEACIELLVDGESVASETGQSDLKMRPAAFDVRTLQGKNARLRIKDAVSGDWGHVAVDQITFEDTKPDAPESLEDLFGWGTLALRLRGTETQGSAAIDLAEGTGGVFAALDEQVGASAPVETGFDTRPAGAIGGNITLAPGEERTVTFVLAWHFPHYPDPSGEMGRVRNLAKLRRHYAKRFTNANAVAEYVDNQFEQLTEMTRLWNRTWYNSTLPYWVLDRTFISLDCLASTTLHWFDSGRVWAWEGTDCCPGTCQHVWNYAQGMARIFPELERSLREVTDYGLAFHKSGALDYRGESARTVAQDGQCGTIMRVWREYSVSSDDAFLRRIWPRVKQSIEFMIAEDGDSNGLLERKQYNTLDQAWVGPMGWISSIYLGALASGAAMADTMGDTAFARRCRAIVETGKQRLVTDLFDGEYFIHKPDDDHKATNTNKGCHIDQVLGQSWASQFGLERVVPKDQTESALQAIWKYNFAPDAGAYREAMQDVIKGGRWYAMPGEAGLLMTTWPKGGAEKAHGTGNAFEVGVGYFNECMNGFEYQVAAHMICEGKPSSDLVEKGLAITRAVHDRYSPFKRNPYNEIECSDHYSRSMAAYGVFLALCGFEYNGPEGLIGFAPRVNVEDFRAPFTAAEGWGTLAQTVRDGVLTAKLTVVYGRLKLSSVRLSHPGQAKVTAQANGQPAEAVRDAQGRVTIALPTEMMLVHGDAIELRIA